MITEQEINKHNNQSNKKYLVIPGNWIRPVIEKKLEWYDHYIEENGKFVKWNRDINIPENSFMVMGRRQYYPDLNLVDNNEWNNIVGAMRRDDGGYNMLIFDVREDHHHTVGNPHSRKTLKIKATEIAHEDLGKRDLGDGNSVIYNTDIKRETETSPANQYIVNNVNLPQQIANALNLEDFDEEDFKGNLHFRSEVEDYPDYHTTNYSDRANFYTIPKNLNLNDIYLAVDIEGAQEDVKEMYSAVIRAKNIRILKTDQEVLNLINNNQNNTSPVPDNAAIQQYNQQITKKLEEFQDRNMTLLEDTDLKIGLLMSLEKDDLPEVMAQTDLIFQPQELMKYKEELKGDGEDVARQTNNQTIETRNTQLIQEWENNFARRQAAVNELQKILDRINNPDTQENPNNNGQQNSNGSDNRSPNQPTNPIIENNQQSEENIRNINQNNSLEETKQRIKQEINDLLDRYGVKSIELNASLWVNQSNWETYLNTLTTIEQITDFVKKMKSAIIQRNNQNNQVNRKLSVPQLQDKEVKEIKELLKKHPLVKAVDLLIKGQNWEEKLRSLTTQQQVLSLARQLRETIIQHSNQQKQKQKQKQKPNSSSAIPLKIAIPVGLGVLGTLAAGIFIIRHRRIARLKIKNKHKSVNN